MKKIVLCLIIMIGMLIPQSLGIISTGYSHSYDYYSVSYDGEGDSIVRAKLTIDNDETEDISSVSLEFPGRNIVFYDVFLEGKAGRTCLRYRNQPTCVEYDEYYNCEKYEESEVCESWSTKGPIFSKIESLTEEPNSESTILKMDLPNPIEKGDSGAITIVYKIPRSAESFAGAFSFEFKTIIDPKAKIVDNVRVSINVDNNLYLKGGPANVDYRSDFFGAPQASVAMEKISSDVDYYNEFSRKITSSKGIIKTATNLDPWESFVVSGKYSKSYARVHIWGIFMLIIVLLGVGFGIYYVGKKVMQKINFSKKKQNSDAFFVVGVTSALQAVALTVLWFIAYLLVSNVGDWIGYRYDDIFAIVLVLLFAMIMLTVFFMPPFIIAQKRSIYQSAATFALTIFWLLIIVLVIILFLSILEPYRPPYFY